MNAHTRNLFVAIMAIAIFSSAHAQTLYTYTNAETGAPGTVAAGITASNISPVNGVVVE